MSSDPFIRIEELLKDIDTAAPKDQEALEAFRIQYLGSKNIIKPLFALMREIPNEKKKEFGQQVNNLKNTAEAKYQHLKDEFEMASLEKRPNIDITAPGEPVHIGSRHPVSISLQKMIDIFHRIGFVVAEEREVEDDWHNFTAMNTPEDHPARDMQDTFYVKNEDNYVLRTHTSSVQARIMTSVKPPIRMIMPGRVYRNETISARSHCQFHQLEGLYIDKNVSFADLKQTLYYFAREMFGDDVKIRLRPSYFPFTEPSAEMDVYWGLKDEVDYRITKGTGWLEVLGCGMVDPNVLRNCGIDPEEYTGFAFGIGIERMSMLKYQIDDIRHFFENDVRFLKQFTSAQ
jgi:phenylalanyl-tRNA synthetase alpha chain